jgi:hypothetical protein
LTFLPLQCDRWHSQQNEERNEHNQDAYFHFLGAIHWLANCFRGCSSRDTLRQLIVINLQSSTLTEGCATDCLASFVTRKISQSMIPASGNALLLRTPARNAFCGALSDPVGLSSTAIRQTKEPMAVHASHCVLTFCVVRALRDILCQHVSSARKGDILVSRESR